MVSFNILKEQTFPVQYLDGHSEKIGLRQLLKDAHLIAPDIMPFKDFKFSECIAYRFLLAFVMDAYRFANNRAIKKVINEGKFSEEVIDGYIEKCEKEGCSFDLFDEEKPFMQADKAAMEKFFADEKTKKKINENIGHIALTLPSGNNCLFFHHIKAEDYAEAANIEMPKGIGVDLLDYGKLNPQDTYSFSPDEYFFWLLCFLTIQTSKGQGHSPNIIVSDSDIPSMFLNKGNTLFESLISNCFPVDEADKPLWRLNSINDYTLDNPEIKNIFSGRPVLLGLFYPLECIYPDTESVKNGKISRMYHAIGEGTKNRVDIAPIWKSCAPYVAKQIKATKEGSKIAPYKVSFDSAPWLEMCLALKNGLSDAVKSGVTRPPVFSQIQELCEYGNIPVNLNMYMCETSKSSYTYCGRYNQSMPIKLLSERESVYVQKYLDYVYNVDAILKKDISKSDKYDQNTNFIKMSGDVSKVRAQWLEMCYKEFFNEIVPTVCQDAFDFNEDYINQRINSNAHSVSNFLWQTLYSLNMYRSSLSVKRINNLEKAIKGKACFSSKKSKKKKEA